MQYKIKGFAKERMAKTKNFLRKYSIENTVKRQNIVGALVHWAFHPVGSLITDSSYILLGKYHKRFQCLSKCIIEKMN